MESRLWIKLLKRQRTREPIKKNVRNSNYTHHLSVYTYSSYIHHNCGGYCLFTFGFTRASNEIDDTSPHFLVSTGHL